MARYRSGPDQNEFLPAARLADVPPGRMRRVDVDGRGVLLVNLGGTIYALDNACPHNGGPLAGGQLDASAGQVTCPWHAWTWDVRTGQAVAPPVGYRAATYPVRIEGQNILVGRYPG